MDVLHFGQRDMNKTFRTKISTNKWEFQQEQQQQKNEYDDKCIWNEEIEWPKNSR